MENSFSVVAILVIGVLGFCIWWVNRFAAMHSVEPLSITDSNVEKVKDQDINSSSVSFELDEISEPHAYTKLNFWEEYQFHEIQNFRQTSEKSMAFITVKTVSLEIPHILEMTIVDDEGNAVFSLSKGAFDTTADGSYWPEDVEDAVIAVIVEKSLVSYNIDFIRKALKHTFPSTGMEITLNGPQFHGLCLLKACKELFRFHKTQTFKAICAHIGLENIDDSDELKKAQMLMLVYRKIAPIITIHDTWMIGFTDISLIEMKFPDGTSLSYWSSQDDERHCLFRPGSILGSGKVAEISKNLLSKLDEYGSAEFQIKSVNTDLNDIQISTLSIKEAKENRQYFLNKYRLETETALLEAKLPKAGKLRLKVTLNCFEANKNRVPKLELFQCYLPYVKPGDTLYLPSLTFTKGFNVRDISFVDSTGQSCGFLQNETKAWLRVFGILMKGYRAEVKVLPALKGLHVDVFFIKDSISLEVHEG